MVFALALALALRRAVGLISDCRKCPFTEASGAELDGTDWALFCLATVMLMCIQLLQACCCDGVHHIIGTG